LAPGDDMIMALEDNQIDINVLIDSLHPEQLQTRYAANKWTLGQVLIHLADEERYYAYKAFCCSRGVSVFLEVPMSDAYKADFNANGRNLQDVQEELAAVRAATITLFQTMTQDMLDLRDESQAEVYTARSLGWFAAGHSNHHLRIIKNKYLTTKQ
ncbi:MAG: DinB family protein, partial [Bacteroidetes bacterium]|nr:DinB family protein [Bacteroidota bacterium]